ncbi:N-acetylmuramoyl-L-alanine amidase family protein [Helicobacter mustelae]|uniref:N-acetylmuramoyl-L-alanine amidase n=1 Tax=Helicobacter mustelae (strain ATCC 43772 / CCUG 25715 / CIP 103759 / LMG 18044 / NCTC 12198 / R85-136P) TaxID=679897 RepID=D3UH85_HELM1|nr:N-acetylmuramoyl-L-alanine amidase [Helicobacter mustelae]CBG39857.1 putative N-acetylmuramoyl-L-alanine amidase [Helicobacter mustelae 12198]SQH71366.1 N-acetylmuramoyl-L-alanine amidase [Helicobacter mustelae]
MRGLCCLFILFCGFLSANLKILSVVPFDTHYLKVTFNQPLSQKDLRIRKVKNNRTLIELNAILIPYTYKRFDFPQKNQIIISQNTPRVVRIFLIDDGKKNFSMNLERQYLIFRLQDAKIPLLQEKSKNSKKHQFSHKKDHIQPSLPTTKTHQKSQKDPSKQNPIKPLPAKALLPESTNSLKEDARSRRKYRIVIDAGHGGKDCGSTAVIHICEKVIVLNVAKKLAKELRARNYQVFMTRDRDIYIDLKARTEMANARNADLFISIHANSVPKTGNKHAQGVETYFLSTARSERARDVAEHENKGDVEIMSYFTKLSFLNTLNSHRLIASNKLAIDIQIGILRELQKDFTGVVDGGVREGPFWVLVGALMPSVLIEIGYLSNEVEARNLATKEYQQSLAIGIANGIDGFIVKNF